MIYLIRDAVAADLPAILAIYNDAVVHTTASYDYQPRSEERQRAWFATKCEAGLPVLVAQDDGAVAGFGSYGPFRAWDGYRFTVEHSVYVAGPYRRRGIATALVTTLMGRARSGGLHLMVAGIDAANAGSIELHRRLGFQDAGVLREAGYKFDRWLDLAFMTRRLEAAAGTAPVSPPARG